MPVCGLRLLAAPRCHLPLLAGLAPAIAVHAADREVLGGSGMADSVAQLEEFRCNSCCDAVRLPGDERPVNYW
jgi:hypothetical protein